MRRLTALSLLSLILTVLLVAASGTCQTATAQQPTLNLSVPATSLEKAVRTAESDSVLVDLAVALQGARADTEISFSEYRKGIHLFRRHHPGFYGNFFGDPFYATYDREYQKLARERQLAEPDINPANSIRNDTWFFCWPSTYDPAFNGECRGFTFAASDFTFLPSFIALRQPETRTRSVSAAEHRPSPPQPSARERERGASPSEPDTLMRQPDRNDPDAGERATASIQVPEEAASRMQKRASVLRRVELKQRVRDMIEKEYGDRETLTLEERADLATRFSEAPSSPDRSFDVRDRRDDMKPRIPSDPSGADGHLERIEDLRERLEARADRSPPSPGRTAPSHRPPLSDPDANPSPSGTDGPGGSSDARSSSTNRNPRSLERDGSGGER